MSIPKQDERTPGPWVARSDDWVFWIGVEGDFADGCDFISIAECHTNSLVPRAAAEANAAFIVQACNAYGSTDALRSALAEMIYETTHLSPENPDGGHLCVISGPTLNKGRTALAGVTAPETRDASNGDHNA